MGAARERDLVGVDQERGRSGAQVVDQAGGRVHVQGRAHHGEDVRPRHPPGRLRDHRDRLPEPDDMGTQRGAVRIRLTELQPAVADVADPGLVPDAAHLGQLPVQVQHLRAPGALVQVVHVLGDDPHVEEPLELRQDAVPKVWLRMGQLFPALVVELGHQLGVAVPPLDAGDLHDVVLLPKPPGVAEGLEPALGAHPRPGQHDQALSSFVPAHPHGPSFSIILDDPSSIKPRFPILPHTL